MTKKMDNILFIVELIVLGILLLRLSDFFRIIGL